MKGKKILVIDDDPSMCDLVKELFSRAGAHVWVAYDGERGLDELHVRRPDLILLDIMMPGDDGMEILRQIRQISNVAVIMLTALTSHGKAVSCLAMGADDYVTKPFYPNLLEARANAVLRRSVTQDSRANGGSVYQDGNLKIDVPARHVSVGGHQVQLTVTEFRLLTFLQQNADRICYFTEILENVWGEEYRGNTEYVHTYVWQLRQKIEKDPRNPAYLVGVRSVGYCFQRQHE
jgi:DNA-binding response OmpR family regulator